MKKNKTLLIATAICILSACSNETETASELNAPVEIRLSSGLDIQTRTAYESTQGEEFASGETVYVWADEVKDPVTEYISAWVLTTGSSGAMSGSTQYYPISGNNLNIYAIHGYFSTAPSGEFPTSPLFHTVSTSQNSEYAKSDLLFGKKIGCGRQTAAHQLSFSHLLSKIEVYLIAGTGMTDANLTNATVTILNTKLSANVTLDKTNGGSVAVSGTIDETTKNAITAKMQYQTDQTVEVSGASKSSYAFGEAIIVPQWVNSTGASGGTDVDFIKVTLSGGGDYIAKINKEFEAGKRYTYFVTVNASGLTLSSTIEQWGTGTTPAEGISAQ